MAYDKDRKHELPEWRAPTAWVMPAGACEPRHFKDLFKAVVQGPGVWAPSDRLTWHVAFDDALDQARCRKPRWGDARQRVEAARRAFFAVARYPDAPTPAFYGKDGATYSLASYPVKGWQR